MLPIPAMRGFTLIELLVVIAILATLAGLLIPSIFGARSRADRLNCLNNLVVIGITASTYADDHRGAFPLAPGTNPPAHESLNILVQAHPELHPDLFNCISSGRNPAATSEDNHKFELTEETNCYAWIGKRTQNTSSPKWALASDDSIRKEEADFEGNHRDGINIAYVGGNAEWIGVDQLPEGEVLPRRLVDNRGERPKR